MIFRQKCCGVSIDYSQTLMYNFQRQIEFYFGKEIFIIQNTLFIGFKGKYNSSGILVQSIAKNFCLLTNSFNGLKKDIDYIDGDYDFILMFGVDKKLENSLRIESVAEKNGVRYSSILDLENISERLNNAGVDNYISTIPTHYLCNEAYWYILKKFNGKAVFIHIPTIKYINDSLIKKVKQALC